MNKETNECILHILGLCRHDDSYESAQPTKIKVQQSLYNTVYQPASKFYHCSQFYSFCRKVQNTDYAGQAHEYLTLSTDGSLLAGETN